MLTLDFFINFLLGVGLFSFLLVLAKISNVMEEMETNFYQNPLLLDPVPHVPSRKHEDYDIFMKEPKLMNPAISRLQNAIPLTRSFSSPDEFVASHKT